MAQKKSQPMTVISTVPVQNVPIEFLYDKGYIGYTINVNGSPYGSKVKLESKKVIDIISAVALIIGNALDTKQALDDNK